MFHVASLAVLSFYSGPLLECFADGPRREQRVFSFTFHGNRRVRLGTVPSRAAVLLWRIAMLGSNGPLPFRLPPMFGGSSSPDGEGGLLKGLVESLAGDLEATKRTNALKAMQAQMADVYKTTIVLASCEPDLLNRYGNLLEDARDEMAKMYDEAVVRKAKAEAQGPAEAAAR